ncbi:hypothetical protein PInf_017717 [Phytophthora infestans]|nr:hypothetical protein PInf_017717 [Phytophthora infestans]
MVRVPGSFNDSGLSMPESLPSQAVRGPILDLSMGGSLASQAVRETRTAESLASQPGPASAPAAEAQVLDEEEKESGDSASLTLLATAARHLESI